MPVPNNRPGIDWQQQRTRHRELVLELLEQRVVMAELRRHSRIERVITLCDWEHRAGVHLGATFELAYSVEQMLSFRPHNFFHDIEDCYIVGRETHPGSGLPTIYESGRIAADPITKQNTR